MNMVDCKNIILLFLLGLRDSISVQWINKLVLITHPTNKKIHPQSYKLLNTLKQTFIQVFIFSIGIPAIFRYFQQEVLSLFFSTLFLVLTYGYIFFYNSDIIICTKQILRWASSLQKQSPFPPIDFTEKSEMFYTLSNTLKSFVFLLLYYTPIFIFCLILSSFIPWLGAIFLLISESFFNSTFYFLKNWPYDRFNVAFLEKQLPYMLGYGFFVSFVTNILFTGDIGRGLYFMISQWMIINAVVYSPPDIEQEENLEKIQKVLLGQSNRSSLGNGYNTHRQKIRNEKSYQKSLMKNIKLLKPALQITEYLNSLANRVTQQ